MSTVDLCYSQANQTTYKTGFIIALITGIVLILSGCFLVAIRWELEDNLWLIGWVLFIFGLIAIVVSIMFKTNIIAPPPPNPVDTYKKQRAALKKISPKLDAEFDQMAEGLGVLAAMIVIPEVLSHFGLSPLMLPIFILKKSAALIKLGTKTGISLGKRLGSVIFPKKITIKNRPVDDDPDDDPAADDDALDDLPPDEDLDLSGTQDEIESLGNEGIDVAGKEAEKLAAEKAAGKAATEGIIGESLGAMLTILNVPMLAFQIGNIISEAEKIGNFGDAMTNNEAVFMGLMYPIIHQLKEQNSGLPLFMAADPLTSYKMSAAYALNKSANVPDSIKEDYSTYSTEWETYKASRMNLQSQTNNDVIQQMAIWSTVSTNPKFLICNLIPYLWNTFCLHKGYTLGPQNQCLYDMAQCNSLSEPESPDFWKRTEWHAYDFNKWIKDMPDYTKTKVSSGNIDYSASDYLIKDVRDVNGNLGVCMIGNQMLRNFCSYPACRPKGTSIAKDNMGFIYDTGTGGNGVLCSVGVDYCQSKGGDPPGCTNSTGGPCYNSLTGECLKGSGEPVAAFFAGSIYANEINATENLKGTRCFAYAEKAISDEVTEGVFVALQIIAAIATVACIVATVGVCAAAVPEEVAGDVSADTGVEVGEEVVEQEAEQEGEQEAEKEAETSAFKQGIKMMAKKKLKIMAATSALAVAGGVAQSGLNKQYIPPTCQLPCPITPDTTGQQKSS